MITTRRWLLALVVLALVAAACGDSGTEPAPAATNAPAPTEAPTATTAAPAAATDGMLVSTVDGPEAPNFALTLGETTDQFVLGDVNKPVYLVFWADW